MTCADLQPGQRFRVILATGGHSLPFTLTTLVPGRAGPASGLAECVCHPANAKPFQAQMTSASQVELLPDQPPSAP